METPAVQFAHYIDPPITWYAVPRCLIIRGWCYATKQQPLHGIRLLVGDLRYNGIVGKLRPDVKAALPEAPDDNTGFEIRGVLPSGRYALSIEAQLADGTWHRIFSRSVTIRRRWWPLWAGGGDWTDLMLCQVPCQIKYPPRILKLETFPAANHGASHTLNLSIVTPSFQQAQFLLETMRSVLNQTGINCEYVIQDGDSTDGSAEIIRRCAHEQAGQNETRPEPNALPLTFSQPRLIAWASEPDAGQGDAIAQGFAKTSGGPDDLMAWINSDDFYLPGTFAFVADFFARNPTVDVIYGHRLLVDESSREIGRWHLPIHSNDVLRLYDFVPQETLFWRRRIWDKVGGLDPSFKFALDWDLLLRFEAAGAKMVRVPYFLATFRVHSAQKTSAHMDLVGQKEIDALRLRTFQRVIPPTEIENDPTLLRYLRRSAWIELLWRMGIRTR